MGDGRRAANLLMIVLAIAAGIAIGIAVFDAVAG